LPLVISFPWSSSLNSQSVRTGISFYSFVTIPLTHRVFNCGQELTISKNDTRWLPIIINTR
jgi:hypothetical protein